jgi:pilus assembly protein CpaE
VNSELLPIDTSLVSPVAPVIAPVVAVVSPKGGTGKTTVAVNLAAAMAAYNSTVLVDMDLDNGNVEYALRLHPAHRLPDLVQRLAAASRVDPELMLTPSRGRLQVVCAPADSVGAAQITPQDCGMLISELSALQHPMVIDTAAGLSSYHLTAMQAASHVALVSTTDVAAVHAARRLVDNAVKDGIPIERIHLILNRANSHLGLTPADVEAVLGLPLWLEIPEHADLAATANLGAPLRMIDPFTPISQRFSAYADQILGRQTHPLKTRNRLRRRNRR